VFEAKQLQERGACLTRRLRWRFGGGQPSATPPASPSANLSAWSVAPPWSTPTSERGSVTPGARSPLRHRRAMPRARAALVVRRRGTEIAQRCGGANCENRGVPGVPFRRFKFIGNTRVEGEGGEKQGAASMAPLGGPPASRPNRCPHLQPFADVEFLTC